MSTKLLLNLAYRLLIFKIICQKNGIKEFRQYEGGYHLFHCLLKSTDVRVLARFGAYN